MRPRRTWLPTAFLRAQVDRVDVLVDGAVALPRIATAIRAAERSVDLTGSLFSPEFELARGDDRQALSELLRETAGRGVEVRLLAWAGAPLPLFRPGRRQVEAVMADLADGARLRVATDRRERPLHCHHEKLVIIDGRQAFVGGIDLTRTSPATGSTAAAIRSGTATAGTTPPFWPRGRSSGIWTSTSGCAGRRSPESGSRRRSP